MFIAAGLALASLAIYWQTRGFEFVNLDDAAYVANNPPAQRGLSIASVRWAFSTVYLANYAPLTWLTFLADFGRARLDPGAYHFTNIMFHAANAVLLFLILARLTAAPWPSALVAALFAVHPLHVESVAWVSSRKDVVSTFFGLAAIGAYGEFARRGRIAWYVATLGAFACSLLAKSMWVTLPCLLLLLDLWPLRRAEIGRTGARAWVRLIGEKLPLFAMSAACSAVTVYAQRAGGAMPGSDVLDFRMRATNAIVSYLRYLAATVWPVELIPYYTHPRDTLPAWTIAMSAGFLMAVTAAAWILRRRYPYVLVGWLWFVGTLIPVIGLIQVGAQAMADRYTYVPLTGVFIVFAWAIADVVDAAPRWRYPLAAVCVGLVVAFSVLAHEQVSRWRSSIVLWEYTLEVDPENPIALSNLGEAYIASARFDDAVSTISRALQIDSTNAGNLRNLAVAQRKLGHLDEAERLLRRALDFDPASSRAYNHLALVMMDRGRFEEAGAALNAALAIDADFLDALVNRGNLSLRRLQLVAAAADYEYVLGRDARNAGALSNLGTVRLLESRHEEAIELFERALAIAPRDAVTRTNLALALQSVGRIGDAKAQAELALKDDPSYLKARKTLEELDRPARE